MASSIKDPAVRFLANQTILVARSPIARLADFTTDFSADAAQPGSTLLVQFFDDGTAGEFRRDKQGDTPSNNYGDADAHSSFIEVKFAHHPKKTFEFTPDDYINIGSNRWQQAGDAMGRSVSRALLETAVKKINPTNIPVSGIDKKVTEEGTFTGTGLSFGAWNEKVAAVSQKFTKEYVAEELTAACADADIDPADTVLLLNGKEYGQLLATLTAHDYGSPEPIQAGRIPGLYGFRSVVKIDSLTNVCGNGLRAALVPVNALGIAGRTIPVLNPKLYEDVGTVTDDKSGLVIQFRRGGDWRTDTSDITAEALFGSKLLQPTKIVRIVSATQVSGENPDITPAETGATGPTA